MNNIGFYDFDITTGSAIQAGALFDIFDDLSSILKHKRLDSVSIEDRKMKYMEKLNHKKGFP